MEKVLPPNYALDSRPEWQIRHLLKLSTLGMPNMALPTNRRVLKYMLGTIPLSSDVARLHTRSSQSQGSLIVSISILHKSGCIRAEFPKPVSPFILHRYPPISSIL